MRISDWSSDVCSSDLRIGLGVVQRTFTVNRVTQCVDYATQQFLTHRNFEDAASALGAHAFGQRLVSTQYNGTYGVLLQVDSHNDDAARKQIGSASSREGAGREV